MALYCASIPGNKFLNGVIFGGGELCFIFLSGLILKWLGDIKAFYLTQALLVASQITIALFPEPGLHIYISVFMNVGMLGAWLNISLCIIECRVSPSLYGNTTLICMTIGSVSGSLAPQIANMPDPYPMLISTTITGVAFFATLFLPPAG